MTITSGGVGGVKVATYQNVFDLNVGKPLPTSMTSFHSTLDLRTLSCECYAGRPGVSGLFQRPPAHPGDLIFIMLQTFSHQSVRFR